MRDSEEAARLLRDIGAIFVRTTKHAHLWRLPNGHLIGFSRTASDHRALTNFKRELQKKLIDSAVQMCICIA